MFTFTSNQRYLHFEILLFPRSMIAKDWHCRRVSGIVAILLSFKRISFNDAACPVKFGISLSLLWDAESFTNPGIFVKFGILVIELWEITIIQMCKKQRGYGTRGFFAWMLWFLPNVLRLIKTFSPGTLESSLLLRISALRLWKCDISSGKVAIVFLLTFRTDHVVK